ncbi:MAG: hypothetical protein SGARI_003080, partial [Bacillariaceae sp.]
MRRGYTDLSGFTEEEKKEHRRQQKLQSKRKGKLPNIAPRLNYTEGEKHLKHHKHRLVKKIKAAMSANGEAATSGNFNARLRAIFAAKIERQEKLSPEEERMMMKIMDLEEVEKKTKLKELEVQEAKEKTQEAKEKTKQKKVEAYQKVNADAQKSVQDGQKTAQKTLNSLDNFDWARPAPAASKKQPIVRQSKKQPVVRQSKKNPVASGQSKKKTAARKKNVIVPAPALFDLNDTVRMGEVGRILAGCCISESKYPFAVDEIIGQLDWSNAALPL